MGALGRFEAAVERSFVEDLYARCEAGIKSLEQRKHKEVGYFGLGKINWTKVKAIENEKVEACEEGKRLGVFAADKTDK